MVSLGAERSTVQNPLLRYAQEAGWTRLPPDHALRLRRGHTHTAGSPYTWGNAHE